MSLNDWAQRPTVSDRWKHDAPAQSYHQPLHEPQECAEIMSHAWHRLFRCEVKGCGQVHEYLLDDMPEDSVAVCYGNGVMTVRVED